MCFKLLPLQSMLNPEELFWGLYIAGEVYFWWLKVFPDAADITVKATCILSCVLLKGIRTEMIKSQVIMIVERESRHVSGTWRGTRHLQRPWEYGKPSISTSTPQSPSTWQLTHIRNGKAIFIHPDQFIQCSASFKYSNTKK